MKHISVFSMFVLFTGIACTTSIEIEPDRSGSGGRDSSGSSSSSGSSMQGNGGNDAGLSCDPCQEIDGSRIVRHYAIAKSPDGLHAISDFFYWDKLRNDRCLSLLSEDGHTRCLPSGATRSNHFSDAFCTNPIAYAPSDECGGTIQKYAIEYVTNSDPCVPPFYRIFAIAAPFGGQIFSKSGNSCTVIEKQSGYLYYLVGAPIPPSEFVQIDISYVH